MRTSRHPAIVMVCVCVAAAIAAGAASAHGKVPSPPKPPPLHVLANGVFDPINKGKAKLGRFNLRFHVSRAGVVTGHGDYNGGGSNYISLSSITSFSCSANHVQVTGVALLNHTSRTTTITITADDHGQGAGSTGDHFSISFGSYSRSGSPVAGKVDIRNCP
jgi:hypothetical protein